MYLASIGHSHRNFSAIEILISKDRGILLNDPWLSENGNINELGYGFSG
jgi:hypothetical protein